jgi:NAD(P)-dependent dehydrogenase (short-subunit alcohol dehydrogenase family)
MASQDLLSSTLSATDSAWTWHGKRCLVVGSTGALGSAITVALAQAGATVVLSGKNIKALEKLYDRIAAVEGAAEPAIYPIDFIGAVGSDYEQMAERLQQQLGDLDALIWCAGYWHGMEALANVQSETWFRALHLNCTAPYLLFRAFFEQLRAQRGVAAFALQDLSVIEQAFSGPYGTAQAALRHWVLKASVENEKLLPRVIGLQLPPLKSKLRLQAYPAESVTQVTEATALAPRVLQALASQNGLAVVE